MALCRCWHRHFARLARPVGHLSDVLRPSAFAVDGSASKRLLTSSVNATIERFAAVSGTNQRKETEAERPAWPDRSTEDAGRGFRAPGPPQGWTRKTGPVCDLRIACRIAAVDCAQSPDPYRENCACWPITCRTCFS